MQQICELSLTAKTADVQRSILIVDHVCGTVNPHAFVDGIAQDVRFGDGVDEAIAEQRDAQAASHYGRVGGDCLSGQGATVPQLGGALRLLNVAPFLGKWIEGPIKIRLSEVSHTHGREPASRRLGMAASASCLGKDRPETLYGVPDLIEFHYARVE